MARYLLVAHQTAESPELIQAARRLEEEDAAAEFVLLVPATPPGSLIVGRAGDPYEIAETQARAAARRLQREGVTLTGAQVGDEDPLQAIADELRAGGREYAAIVISTLPAGLSRWLRIDMPSRARRQFPGHRIVHVESSAPRPQDEDPS
jgi:7-keto-8-aminopelargonate synthetase-like enzyme